MTLRTNFATKRMARYTSMLPNLTGVIAVRFRNRTPDEIPESMVPGVLQMFVGAVDIQVIDKAEEPRKSETPGILATS